MTTKDIQRMIEQEYDIPFVVREKTENGEPVFIMGPDNPGKELFQIRISFRNGVRMLIEFVPEKYSVPFIESMSEKPEENRRQFVSYARLMSEDGIQILIRADDKELDITDLSSWPEKWHNLTVHASKFPAFEEDDPDYSNAAYRYGSLMLGMILSLADIVPVDDEKPEGYAEGKVITIESKRYERNRLNRKLCVEARGYRCAICGFDFEEKYGILGSQFIHVHHVVPVSKLGPNYIIDPLKDLIPVCPNCHAMLHRRNPPFSPQELVKVIQDNQSI